MATRFSNRLLVYGGRPNDDTAERMVIVVSPDSTTANVLLNRRISGMDYDKFILESDYGRYAMLVSTARNDCILCVIDNHESNIMSCSLLNTNHRYMCIDEYRDCFYFVVNDHVMGSDRSGETSHKIYYFDGIPIWSIQDKLIEKSPKLTVFKLRVYPNDRAVVTTSRNIGQEIGSKAPLYFNIRKPENDWKIERAIIQIGVIRRREASYPEPLVISSPNGNYILLGYAVDNKVAKLHVYLSQPSIKLRKLVGYNL